MAYDFGKDIVAALKAITTEVEDEMKEVTIDVAKEGVKMLKAESPKNSGDYAKSWTRKKDGDGQVVYNKDHYRLTHLLEKGHAKVGGGRVSAQPHIKPVEEKLEQMMIDELERRL